jgi:hypothetical protein
MQRRHPSVLRRAAAAVLPPVTLANTPCSTHPVASRPWGLSDDGSRLTGRLISNNLGPTARRQLRLFQPSSRLGPIHIGRIFTPLLLVCLACGLRTPLTDATRGGSTSGGHDQTNDQASWDGGLLASTPGQVRCGLLTCGYGGQCCLRLEGRPASNGCDSPATPSCHGTPMTALPGAPYSVAPYRRECDETADCNPGEICCWTDVADPPPTIASYCRSATEAQGDCDYIACGSADDCRALGAPSCVAQRCRGDVLQSCGLMPSGYCTP